MGRPSHLRPWELTEAPLTHVRPAHVFTDELGLGTELLWGTGYQVSDGRRSDTQVSIPTAPLQKWGL